MKINYKIKEIRPNIFALIIPNQYDLSMLFWKVQEFYESSGKKFKGKKFNFWDYAKWYSEKYEGCFSYTNDYVGYNLPVIIAKKCYELNNIETPYDEIMSPIINSLYESGKRRYLIGMKSLKGGVFNHELAHALYYSNIDYKNEMDELYRNLSKSIVVKLNKNLFKLGYCKEVLKDEIQAYLSTDINNVFKGIKNIKEFGKKYKKVFNQFQ